MECAKRFKGYYKELINENIDAIIFESEPNNDS